MCNFLNAFLESYRSSCVDPVCFLQVKSSAGAGDVVNDQAVSGAVPVSSGKPVPSQQDRNHFQKAVSLSSKLMFRCGVATPLQSSPVSRTAFLALVVSVC